MAAVDCRAPVIPLLRDEAMDEHPIRRRNHGKGRAFHRHEKETADRVRHLLPEVPPHVCTVTRTTRWSSHFGCQMTVEVRR